MRVRPARLNAAITWLFMVGSACFVLGSVPAYVSAVGAWPDAATYFVGSLFFTSASWAQLVQSQSPDMSEVDQRQQNVSARLVVWAWLPKDRNWLAAATQVHPPPIAKGRRVKLRFVTQASTRPPTFVLFVSQAAALPDSYLRYLTNSLREAFDLPGVPLRLRLRTGKNPYV